jgi:SAM-dependent methyltransferase
MSAVAGDVRTGNTFDKYGSANPVVRRLMAGFIRDADSLMTRAAGRAGIESMLDVGCGEGVLTERWAARLEPARVVGVDLEDASLRAHWAQRPERPNLRFGAMSADALGFGDGEFELVAATEVLEHLPDPAGALAEMARVAARWLLVSVPREPLWRGLNLARGAYVSALGNTPGHLNHWSRPALVRLLAHHGELVETRSPLPWTMALVRVGQVGDRDSHASGSDL